MNAEPDAVLITVLSLISLRNWTCGANSVPYAAVAIKQPPPFASGSLSTTTWQIPFTNVVTAPHVGSGSLSTGSGSLSTGSGSLSTGSGSLSTGGGSEITCSPPT